MYHLATSLTPELSKQLGPLMQMLLYLLGAVYLVILVWQRVRGEPSEPKQNPPIHAQISKGIDESEKRIGTAIGTVKAELKGDLEVQKQHTHTEIHRLHGRVSNLREEIRGDLNRSVAKIDQGVEKMLDIVSEQRERISKVEASTEAQERRIIASETKLDRHIENGLGSHRCPTSNT